MSNTPTSYVMAPVKTLVYTRRSAAANGSLPINGEESGWTLESSLRCDNIVLTRGPQPGAARFTIIPIDDPETIAIETAFAPYTTDDQVRVVALPIDDENVQQPTNPDDRFILFEGFLSRHVFSLDGGKEVPAFEARPFPVLDNCGTEHLVRGRWMMGPSDTTPFVVESPCVPAIFNYGNRPNQNKTLTFASAGGDIDAPVFTDDDDTDGVHWVAGTAILSLLAMWLYGPDSAKLNRFLDVEPDTLAALIAIASFEAPDDIERFGDLAAQLPEVNVHGLGLLDALQKICDTAGFDFACEPFNPPTDANSDGGDDSEPAPVPDRTYQIRIWKRNTGEIEYLDLAKRRTAYTGDDAEQFFTDNNLSKVTGMKAGDEIYNEIFAIGRSYCEARFVLKPLWAPGDVDATPIADEMQSPFKSDLQGSGYAAKHIQGGVLYKNYAHVGRLWGLDCFGGFAGYTDDFYKQDEHGFDFVSYLDLTNPANAPTKDRADNGITDPIVWAKRLRRVSALRSPQGLLYPSPLYLEVSEDGGGTWDECHVGCQAIDANFGIALDVQNLTAINMTQVLLGIPALAVESWWALIASKQLSFRVTCVVEADHALRYDAKRQATSGSQYKRGQQLSIQAEEVMVQPNSPFNPASDWKRVQGWSTNNTALLTSDFIPGVKDAANRRRDALEDVRVTAAPMTAIMDFTRYRLGQRIGSIRGRDYSFAANAGTETSYPNVVGITLTLAPAEAQSIELNLDDHMMSAGQEKGLASLATPAPQPALSEDERALRNRVHQAGASGGGY